MIETEITVNDLGLLNDYADALRQAPELVSEIVSLSVSKHSEVLLDLLRTEPGPAVYPIKFTSNSQRKWVFAQAKSGALTLPYQRQHKLRDGWKIRVAYHPPEVTSIEVTNDEPEREFVTGESQQGFHTVTGWYQEQSVFKLVQESLVDQVESDLIGLSYLIEERANGRT